MLRPLPPPGVSPPYCPEHIAAAAEFALLAEAWAAPKPGLVDRLDSGSHRDMDVQTFFSSARALEPFLCDFARLGEGERELPLASGLIRLRPLGMAAEEAMFRATLGVNTHKGAVFTLGILCYLWGRAAYHMPPPAPEALCSRAGELARGVTGELGCSCTGSPTKGEQAFLRYGAAGVRGEAEAGYPSICNIALPAFRQALTEGADLNDALLWTLLKLIAQVEDTTVLMRCGPEAARFAAREAKDVLTCHRPGDAGFVPALADLNRRFIQKRISHGGCADLCAATVFLLTLSGELPGTPPL